MALISSSVGNLKSGFNTHQLESIPGRREQTFTLSGNKRSVRHDRTGLIREPSLPVRLKSAQSFSRFLILLSEWEGKAFFMSSMRILRGRSLLFQNRR